jgi:hypothetical protein
LIELTLLCLEDVTVVALGREASVPEPTVVIQGLEVMLSALDGCLYRQALVW